ncbi:hypothetical protein ACI79C_04210 [Geodermatophilus sp. SYSU D00697]
MTRQKHLKAAVPARMARTGERYTTAHRHLTGAAHPTPAVGGGRLHDSALLTRVLAASGPVADTGGRALDEPVVAGRAGGIGSMYFSFSYAGALPTMTIVPRVHPRPVVLALPQPLGPNRSTRMSAAGTPIPTSSWLAASAKAGDPHT